ncbi:hypothetical protein HZ994_00615 [Akkermansiaceae bacterium]|nr:hypothetical protein HZ994_00615 [Akkermansiaceae bacterium]
MISAGMISGKHLLPLLVGTAIAAAGWMRPAGARSQGDAAGDADLLQRIGILEKENASLRSLAQGGGEVAVPPEMIAQVEKDYGLAFLSSPVFHRIATEELGYRIEAALESRLGPQGADDRQEAWRWMGLLKPGDKLLEQLVAVKSVGAVGWFDEVTGEAWVTDRFDIANIPDQAAMLRLLVRVLLNQNFPPPPAYPGDDAARAREALHAGAAKGAESRFYAASARGIGFLPMNDDGPAARLLLSLPAFVQGLVQFPALEGKGLADTAFVKGTAEFSKRMREAPQSTYGVAFPAEPHEGVDIVFPEISDEVYLEESAGYLGLRLWLAEGGDAGLAAEIAGEWVADRYVLFADGEMSSGLAWDVVLGSAEAAGRFEHACRERLGAYAEEGRLLDIERVGERRVRFLNVATPKAMENFKQGKK